MANIIRCCSDHFTISLSLQERWISLNSFENDCILSCLVELQHDKMIAFKAARRTRTAKRTFKMIAKKLIAALR